MEVFVSGDFVKNELWRRCPVNGEHIFPLDKFTIHLRKCQEKEKVTNGRKVGPGVHRHWKVCPHNAQHWVQDGMLKKHSLYCNSAEVDDFDEVIQKSLQEKRKREKAKRSSKIPKNTADFLNEIEQETIEEDKSKEDFQELDLNQEFEEQNNPENLTECAACSLGINFTTNCCPKCFLLNPQLLNERNKHKARGATLLDWKRQQEGRRFHEGSSRKRRKEC